MRDLISGEAELDDEEDDESFDEDAGETTTRRRAAALDDSSEEEEDDDDEEEARKVDSAIHSPICWGDNTNVMHTDPRRLYCR